MINQCYRCFRRNIEIQIRVSVILKKKRLGFLGFFENALEKICNLVPILSIIMRLCAVQGLAKLDLNYGPTALWTI